MSIHLFSFKLCMATKLARVVFDDAIKRDKRLATLLHCLNETMELGFTPVFTYRKSSKSK